MKLSFKNYEVCFENGGVEIQKDGQVLYYNKRPIYVFIKTAYAITEFYDAPYATIEEKAGKIYAEGVLSAPTGAEFQIKDCYEICNEEQDAQLKISRTAEVLKSIDDVGFATKLSFVLAASDMVEDYDVFAPANWYKDNKYATLRGVGYDKTCEYYLTKETRLTLPLCAVQNKASGETIMFSRWAADVTLPSFSFFKSDQVVDPKLTVGSIGLSKPENRTLNYLYYGFPPRKELPTTADGLSIDYVYPYCDGQISGPERLYNIDYAMRTKPIHKSFHPMEEGFAQHYEVALDLNHYEEYYGMMRGSWRSVYGRLRDDLFEVDQKLQYENCMKTLKAITREYDEGVWGVPFVAFMPNFDINSVSLQFGFVGQQPGIGYQLMFYGDRFNDPEAFEKGKHIIDFWTSRSLSEIGLPYNCYSPVIKDFEPYPFWTRMIADGMENILDAYNLMAKIGEGPESWIEYCKRVADWFTQNQNEDGSYYRAYNMDGSMRMDSQANTISIVRFLIQMYQTTGIEIYKETALKAGEWAYQNTYPKLEYRGSTCDNADVQDNESGIYAMFGFLSLYDLTGEAKWLEALIAAADYTETWTYSWSFPVKGHWPNDPLSKNRISGQSPVTVFGGGGDMYMAACAFLYYRLYRITGDAHYLDYAEFIHNNTRQANDVDGSFGYKYPGLSYEGSSFDDQEMHSLLHWLPWVTYVEIDPTSRLLDTYGAYDIAGAEKNRKQEQ